jgi:hypothetical protein
MYSSLACVTWAQPLVSLAGRQHWKSDPYRYAVYKSRGGDAESNLGAMRYYFRGDKALYAAVNTYLIDATWVSRISWKNDADSTLTYG